jgi:hypothetical protein
MGLCILPIHDGFITTRGDEFLLERLMNEASREITGHTAKIKPESFDLSLLHHDDDNNGAHWTTRPDGNVERDTPMAGKAIDYSEVILGRSLWHRLEQDKVRKTNTIERDREWQLAHGHH